MFTQGYPLYAVREDEPGVVYAVVGWESGASQLPVLVPHTATVSDPRSHGWITLPKTEKLAFGTDLRVMRAVAGDKP